MEPDSDCVLGSERSQNLCNLHCTWTESDLHTLPQWRWCTAEHFKLIRNVTWSNCKLSPLSRETPCQKVILHSTILTLKDVVHLSFLIEIISSQLHKYKNSSMHKKRDLSAVSGDRLCILWLSWSGNKQHRNHWGSKMLSKFRDWLRLTHSSYNTLKSSFFDLDSLPESIFKLPAWYITRKQHIWPVQFR